MQQLLADRSACNNSWQPQSFRMRGQEFLNRQRRAKRDWYAQREHHRLGLLRHCTRLYSWRIKSSTVELREAEIRSAFSGVTSPYDTHRPVLCEAIVRMTGPILELGMGEGSTRALHVVAEASGRRVYSYDHDPGWVARYSGLQSAVHTIAQVSSWDACPIDLTQWGVAFVDHAPAERRRVDIVRLAQITQVLVVHDTEDHRYGYDDLLDTFAYRLDHRVHVPWTTLLSNFVDVSLWTIAS